MIWPLVSLPYKREGPSPKNSWVTQYGLEGKERKDTSKIGRKECEGSYGRNQQWCKCSKYTEYNSQRINKSCLKLQTQNQTHTEVEKSQETGRERKKAVLNTHHQKQVGIKETKPR